LKVAICYTGQQPADIFGGGQNDCNLLSNRTTKHVFEISGGGNCPHGCSLLWLPGSGPAASLISQVLEQFNVVIEWAHLTSCLTSFPKKILILLFVAL